MGLGLASAARMVARGRRKGEARCGTGGAGGLSHQQIEAKALRKLRVGLPEGLLSDLIAELREGC